MDHDDRSDVRFGLVLGAIVGLAFSAVAIIVHQWVLP